VIVAQVAGDGGAVWDGKEMSFQVDAIGEGIAELEEAVEDYLDSGDIKNTVTADELLVYAEQVMANLDDAYSSYLDGELGASLDSFYLSLEKCDEAIAFIETVTKPGEGKISAAASEDLTSRFTALKDAIQEKVDTLF